MSADSLLHYVSLDGAGGVELQFVEFLAAVRARSERQQAVVACGQRVHPLVAGRLAGADVPTVFEKYAGPVKLPKWPGAMRRMRQRALIQRFDPGVVLIWNRLRDSLNTLAAAGAHRCVYWERGASWFVDETADKQRFLEEIPYVLCNSHAARRMLELRWGYAGRVEVVHNALRPTLIPAESGVRTLPSARRLRLGVAARLVPIKGVSVAIRALAALAQQGLDIELHIAGDGPEKPALMQLASRLSVADRVHFLGLVSDMGAFYQEIDLLVHPALREPFGQIVVEAAAYGVPAIVAAVDGLVEVVREGQTGQCVVPDVPLSTYRSWGDSTDDLPPFVYRPDSDTIGEPRVVDPDRLAEGIESMLAEAPVYEALSAAALADVRERFDFMRHVDTVLDQIDTFMADHSSV